MKANRFVLAGLVAVMLALVGVVGVPATRAVAEPSREVLVWNLAADFRVFPNQANPNPDSYGNAEVWSFLRSTTAHDPSTYELVTQFYTDVSGVDGLQGWEGPEPTGYPNSGLPSFTRNTTGETIVFEPGRTIPERASEVHPDSSQPAVVGWTSPANGTIWIGGDVVDLCTIYGDGIQWFIDKNATTIASGAYANGGAQSLMDGAGGDQLWNVQVQKGDVLYFLVAPGADYYCDSTFLNLTIRAPVCDKKPKNLLPVDGATVSGPKVQLQWNAVGCAGIYHLRITQVSNGKVVVNEKGLTDPSYTLNAKAGHRYDWQVRACNMGVCGSWSTPQRLFVQR